MASLRTPPGQPRRDPMALVQWRAVIPQSRWPVPLGWSRAPTVTRSTAPPDTSGDHDRTSEAHPVSAHRRAARYRQRHTLLNDHFLCPCPCPSRCGRKFRRRARRQADPNHAANAEPRAPRLRTCPPGKAVGSQFLVGHTRACRQLSQQSMATRWTPARKFLASFS